MSERLGIARCFGAQNGHAPAIGESCTIRSLISLVTLDSRVIGPTGIVFSNAPETATGSDGKTYYVKGWDSEVAFAEVAGCLLAAEAGLRVPVAAVCSFNGRLCAGVEEVERPIRTISPWLAKMDRIVNRSDLYAVIAVDTWLANDDRNMGNLVGSPAEDGRILLSMIDFEKSKTLRRNPTIESDGVGPRALWPTSELGNLLRQEKPPVPTDIIGRIRALPRQRIEAIVRPVAEDLAFVDWSDGSIDVLLNRAERIRALLEEVWRAN
jgi:hypothetical protein